MGGLPARRTVYGFTTDPKDSQIMYAAMLQGLFRSGDAGRTWVLMSTELKSLASVTVHPKRPQEVYVATLDGIVYRSLDGGKTWGRQNKAQN